jgi:hypothetical protein
MQFHPNSRHFFTIKVKRVKKSKAIQVTGRGGL